jgi:drug/metabolite transporter (DMT)-like permease
MRLKADLIMLTAALIWGIAFVVQRLAASTLGTFLFNSSRFLLAALVLFMLARFRVNIKRKNLPFVILAGVILFAASWFQQAGLVTTTAGNAGFLTGLYVVIIPFIMYFFMHQKLRWAVWAAAFIAVVGAFLLSFGGSSFEQLRFVEGDLLELAGAFLWALHVILVGVIVRKMSVHQFMIIQCAVCGVLNLVVGLALESATLPALAPSWWAIAYTGIFSIALGFSLQGYGQRHAPTADAAIVLSMEAVFASLAGFLFLGEVLLPLQILGCVLIFSAILLAQLVPGTVDPELVENRAVKAVGD